MPESVSFSTDIALTLAVAVGALALFVSNRLRVEVVGVLTMLAVILLDLVTPQEAVGGFANEATITVALVLGLSAGLERCGVIDALGRLLDTLAGDSETRLTMVVLALIVPVSALINNTAAVAVLMPMVVALSHRVPTPPSRLLLPLSFGSQLGGALTLIGTSTNLLVAGILADSGRHRFGLFEITPPAIVLALVGGLYLLTAGRYLTPRRKSEANRLVTRELRQYLSELRVEEDSPLVGQDIEETSLGEDLLLVSVIREERSIPATGANDVLRSGDRLLVRGRPRHIAELADAEHLDLVATASDLQAKDRESDGLKLAEMIVSPRSRASGRTLRQLRQALPETVTVLAMERHGTSVREPIERVELVAGDILLVRAPLERLQSLHESGDFALVGVLELPYKRTRKLWLALAILSGVILLAASGVTSILVAALMGLTAMVLTGCLRTEEVYEGIDWRVVVLLGSLLALGRALEATGTATFLAHGLLGWIRPLGPYGVLASLYLLTSLLTELITNNASALVLTPIAVATADDLGLSPLPFVVAVMFAASNSFATPIGYQTNTFIYGPGGYRFSDFLRVGGPLVLLMLMVATLCIPWFFPFSPR